MGVAILSRDLLVIGSGPAGHGGAMAAARLGKSVAVVERKGSAGGPALQAASLPSKALRQAVLSLSRPPAPVPGSSPPAPLPDDLLPLLRERVRVVVEREREAARAVLRAHGVTILEGAARFVDARTVEVTPAVGAPTLVRVGTVLVACGSRPATSPDDRPSTPPTNLTGRTRRQRIVRSPSSAPSTSGTPLPVASGAM